MLPPGIGGSPSFGSSGSPSGGTAPPGNGGKPSFGSASKGIAPPGSLGKGSPDGVPAGRSGKSPGSGLLSGITALVISRESIERSVPRRPRVLSEKKAGRCDCTGPPLSDSSGWALSGRNQQTVGS